MADTDLDALLSYLGTAEIDFINFETAYFAGLSNLLTLHGIFGSSGVIDRSNFGDAVRQFQSSVGLGADGIPGQDTLWELQAQVAEARNLDVVQVDADIWVRPPRTMADYNPDLDGFDSFRLRSDAAAWYQALRDQVIGAGAIITSAGSFRGLDAAVGAGRSATSFHYAGLAIDLSTPTGMTDPELDPYIITQDDGGYWRVWARTDQGLDQLLDAVVYSPASHSISTQTVVARVLDFTGLAASFGFQRIRPRSAFPGNYLAAEWWHFQLEAVLTPWVSQFGIELLALARYTEADLQAVAEIWDRRKAIFGRATDGWH